MKDVLMRIVAQLEQQATHIAAIEGVLVEKENLSREHLAILVRSTAEDARERFSSLRSAIDALTDDK
ncbi:MAG TPA: hypothetical protein VNY97_02020 [Candidatus Angelobacter sp.]|jgi:hypothetical protein|nr:hypothetical protein [Candidatus Angelobacter sp.]